eukprot:jgi/Bigna1/142238/aug1.68_g16946
MKTYFEPENRLYTTTLDFVLEGEEMLRKIATVGATEIEAHVIKATFPDHEIPKAKHVKAIFSEMRRKGFAVHKALRRKDITDLLMTPRQLKKTSQWLSKVKECLESQLDDGLNKGKKISRKGHQAVSVDANDSMDAGEEVISLDDFLGEDNKEKKPKEYCKEQSALHHDNHNQAA